MYCEHFGLQQMPFAITPGTAFAFASRTHQEALNTLLVATQGGEGFVTVTGEVGTGKTLLCRRFLDILNHRGITTAYIPNPRLSPGGLLLAVAHELGVFPTGAVDEYILVKLIDQALMRIAARNSTVVLCLDEAQALPVETLEAIRLLSNLETENRKLLQLVLFGQPELKDKLALHALRPLRQRIGFSHSMGCMSQREVDRYVAHRLGVAGYTGEDLFSHRAIAALHRASGGVPRLVNILCHKAMLAVYGEGGRRVEARHVRMATADTDAARHLRWFDPRRWFAALSPGLGHG